MNIDKAQKVNSIMNRMNKIEKILEAIQNGYRDEFNIYYGDGKACELEEEKLTLLINSYNTELNELQTQLEKI